VPRCLRLVGLVGVHRHDPPTGQQLREQPERLSVGFFELGVALCISVSRGRAISRAASSVWPLCCERRARSSSERERRAEEQQRDERVSETAAQRASHVLFITSRR